MHASDEAARRHAIAYALRLAHGTSLAPDADELALLEAYACGTLTLNQAIHFSNLHRLALPT